MPDYRIYLFTKDGHISGPPYLAECSTDQEAIERATQVIQYAYGRDIEVWEGPRRQVGRLSWRHRMKPSPQ